MLKCRYKINTCLILGELPYRKSREYFPICSTKTIIKMLASAYLFSNTSENEPGYGARYGETAKQASPG